ncbi:carcinoembryonic antigen-related cell adhesion molecule 5-like [Scleropages formosus]|uniref:Carcinoembryonic antigen-related cell adhesion molecule 5-like n=1 Tax=Scleropages formosus TaxID=113540 RepID=A0A8C9WRJ8_SCLFO|nr:carcinoembryonic antigen-related cell adhesion molecule 5-like [Scleropages formosus]
MEDPAISCAALLLISLSVAVADLRGNSDSFVSSAWEEMSTPSGPGDVVLLGPNTVVVGNNYDFTCQAVCNPPCNFTWLFNGVLVASSVSQVSMRPATFNDNGVLACQAQNTVTFTLKAVFKVIRVTDPNNSVSLQPAVQHPPNVEEPYSLKCVTTGNATAALWVKNQIELTDQSGGVQILQQKTVLSFDSLTIFDNAIYQCVAVMDNWQLLSEPFILRVNYGPQKPIVQGMNVLLPGMEQSFRCYFDCHPDCNCTWYLGHQVFWHGSQVRVRLANITNSSILTCEASNPVTGLSNSVSTMLLVPNGPENAIITGPSDMIAGRSYVFKCSAHSYPPSNYTWYLNSREVAQGDVYKISSTRLDGNATLECTAHNALTRLSAKNSTMLKIINEATSFKFSSTTLVAPLTLLLLQLLPLTS